MRRTGALLLLLFLTASPVRFVAGGEYRNPEAKKAFVLAPDSGVYARNNKKAERLTEVLMGDEFTVIRETGDWVYGSIPSQKGYRGWIRKQDISFSLSESPFKGRSFVLVRSTKTRISYRDGSSTDVYAGTRLPLLKENGNRYEVITPDGSTGFLPVGSVAVEDENFGRNVTPQDILTASHFFTSHYKWGGITAGGMDCSGFVYTVFRINGIYLKRDSYMQAEEGTGISPDDLREGDLVFFSSKKGGRITHVGIYIGDGKFIHSSRGKKGVAVSSLSEDYFRKRLAAARRILHAANATVQDKGNAVRPAINGHV
jgi:hypothetical protein